MNVSFNFKTVPLDQLKITQSMQYQNRKKQHAAPMAGQGISLLHNEKFNSQSNGR